jgi:hypothetical protein
MNQLGRHHWQSGILSLRPAILDHYIFAFNKTGFGPLRPWLLPGSKIHIPEHLHLQFMPCPTMGCAARGFLSDNRMRFAAD